MISKIFFTLVGLYIFGCFLGTGGILYSNYQKRQETALQEKSENAKKNEEIKNRAIEEYKKRQEIERKFEDQKKATESQIAKKREHYEFPFEIKDEFGRVVHYEYNYELYCKFEYYKNTDKINSAIFSNLDKIENLYEEVKDELLLKNHVDERLLPNNILDYHTRFDDKGKLEYRKIERLLRNLNTEPRRYIPEYSVQITKFTQLEDKSIIEHKNVRSEGRRRTEYDLPIKIVYGKNNKKLYEISSEVEKEYDSNETLIFERNGYGYIKKDDRLPKYFFEKIKSDIINF